MNDIKKLDEKQRAALLDIEKKSVAAKIQIANITQEAHRLEAQRDRLFAEVDTLGQKYVEAVKKCAALLGLDLEMTAEEAGGRWTFHADTGEFTWSPIAG